MIQLLHKSKHDMGELKRTWDLISNDKRKISIEEIKTFFAKE